LKLLIYHILGLLVLELVHWNTREVSGYQRSYDEDEVTCVARDPMLEAPGSQRC